MKTTVLLIALALGSGGCASSKAGAPPAAAESETAQPAAQQPSGMHGGMMGGDMAGMCPMTVEGTVARAEDVEGGAAMVFTTTGDVGELRRRVAAMAEMHNRHHAGGHDHRKGAQSGQQGKMGMMGGGMMPPSTARSEEVEGGARIVFAPQDPADLAKLREQVRQHAEMMASGRCPMMSHGHGDEPAPPSNEHETHHPEGGAP